MSLVLLQCEPTDEHNSLESHLCFNTSTPTGPLSGIIQLHKAIG
jgi:hypothetical protein